MSVFLIKEKIIFIHIPKTGGTSFKFLIDNEKKEYERLPTHSNIQIIKNTIKLNESYSFCFVRNPYSRIISMFNFSFKKAHDRYYTKSNVYTKHSESKEIDKKIINFYERGFEYWLSAIFNKDPIFDHSSIRDGLQNPSKAGQWWNIYNNQVDWISLDNIVSTVDIFKIEEIEYSFSKIQKKLKLNQSLPRINNTKYFDYCEIHNENTKKMVAEIFRKDLEILKYQF